MRKLLITIICVIVMSSLWAQAPKNEFLFQSKDTRTELSRGGTSNLALSIVRSRRYIDSEMKLSVGSGLPPGVALSFQPVEGTASSATASLAVSEAAVPGTYNVVLNCTMGNKTKGIIVKLTVLE